jgi:carbon monoxide dehydrogenase subunit G
MSPASATRSTAPFAITLRDPAVKVTVSGTCPAPPEVVWEWIADPHKHIRMLPDEVRDGRVLENGDMACELVTMGVRERMVVRMVASEPPHRLVEERVDGRRRGTSVFELEPEGDHATRVTLTSEVDLPRLMAAVASAPVRSALDAQLRNLAALVATGD